jgi:hypothetical protein
LKSILRFCNVMSFGRYSEIPTLISKDLQTQ